MSGYDQSVSQLSKYGIYVPGINAPFPSQVRLVSPIPEGVGVPYGVQTKYPQQQQQPQQPQSGGEVKGASTGEDSNAALYREIDNIYNESMGLANQYQSKVEANQPTVNADIEGQYQGSQQTLEADKMAGERSLQSSGEMAGQTRENALAAGTRLFNELQMGNVQRFGGKSMAGNFVSELQGREHQRGQATTQQAYQNAMTKITELKSNLQERYSSAMFNLEQQKNQALKEARRQFDEQIMNINAMKVQAGQNKSQMRIELLQNLRNQIYQINLAGVQTSTALAQQQQQGEQELANMVNQVDQANSMAEQTGQTQASSSITNPNTAYNPQMQSQAPQIAQTGQINKRDDDIYR